MESETQGLGQRKPEKKFIGLPFIGGTAFFFVLSLALALLGVFHGTHLLRWLNADGKVDLQTMGELLGGTLGVAVAFAGAWVAFQIANFANQTLQLQERREASRTANETLEQSIGKILSAQLHFEALLRQIQALAELASGAKHESKNGEVNVHRAKIEKAQTKVETAAESLSQAIQRVLTNPLAISVLFALQEGETPDDRDTKPGQHKIEVSEDQGAEPIDRDSKRKQLLEDLSQLPRQLDDVKASLEVAVKPRSLMLSPYKMLPLMKGVAMRIRRPGDEVLLHLKSELEYLAVMNEKAVPVMSLIDHATSGRRVSLSSDLREPFLLHALRSFVYTEKEARAALEKLFPEEVYQDEAARRAILRSPPAEAFVSSGQINDELMRVYLDFSARTHPRLEALSKAAVGGDARAEAIRFTVVKAVLEANDCYDDALVNDLVRDSKNLPAFAIYYILAKASDQSSDSDTRAHLFRRDISKYARGVDVRNKLTGISDEYGDLCFDVPILNTVALATHANATQELGALSFPRADWQVSCGQLPEPGDFFEQLQASLKRQIIHQAFPRSESELRAAVVQEVEKVACFPRAVKLLCLAVRTLTRNGYSPSDLRPLIARGWDVENWELGPDLLCVGCGFHGLETQVEAGVVRISHSSDEQVGFACVADAEAKRFRVGFELSGLDRKNLGSGKMFSDWGSLEIDGWIYETRAGQEALEKYRYGDALMSQPWDDLLSFRSFVAAAIKLGVTKLPATRANALYLAQLLAKSAREAGFEVTRTDVELHVRAAEPVESWLGEHQAGFPMLRKSAAMPDPRADPEQLSLLKAKVIASGGEASDLRIDLEGGPAWQKAQIDEFLRKVGQRCPLLAEAELFRGA